MWIQDFATSTIFLVVITSFFIAQFLKFITYSIKFKKLFWRGLFESGGLPSGHSAVVASLTTAIYLAQGFSPLFYMTFFVSCIVMYDAMGVRQETGRQGAFLNSLAKKHKVKLTRKFKEFVGHSPVEVFFGALIGFLVAMIYAL